MKAIPSSLPFHRVVFGQQQLRKPRDVDTEWRGNKSPLGRLVQYVSKFITSTETDVMKRVIRFCSPAVLMRVDDDLLPTSTIVGIQSYREMHGYLPVPHCEYMELFKEMMPRSLFRMVEHSGSVRAILTDEEGFEVQIDIVFKEELPDKLLSMLDEVASKLFNGQLGGDITISSCLVAGIGIVSIPSPVRVECLAAEDLLAELRDRLVILNANTDFEDLNERSGLYSAASWLTQTLEAIMPEEDANIVREVMTTIHGSSRRKSTQEEIALCEKLFRHVGI